MSESEPPKPKRRPSRAEETWRLVQEEFDQQRATLDEQRRKLT